MENGHDRRFLRQDPLCFLIQPYPLTLVQAALGVLYQAIVILILPSLSLNITDSHPQKVVGIGIIGPPAQDKEMRHLLTQSGRGMQASPSFPT